MSQQSPAAALFGSHEEAEAAIRELQKGDVDMKTLSIVGRDYHAEEHLVGYYATGDRMLYWGKSGAFWGGFWGLLLGSAIFWAPGVGQILVAGPLVMCIVGALGEVVVVGGLVRLGTSLYSIGIPKDSVMQYESEVKNGKLLLIVHGTQAEVERAKDILSENRGQTVAVHGKRAAAVV